LRNFIFVDHSRCTGCKSCEMVCSLYHFQECNPKLSAIRIIRKERDGLVLCLPLVCQHCQQAYCIEACPTGAISKDEQQGIIVIDNEQCNACGACVEACPIGCISTDDATNVAIHCDLCGGHPMCVPACHAHCLTEAASLEEIQTQGVEYLTRVLEHEDLWGNVPGKESN
jgi:carbon-monoxide dehydrogenase iron sulfur subunit